MLAAFAASLCIAQAHAQQTRTNSGLIESGDWQLVYANCFACHSLALVTAQRGDTSYWRDIVREMQTNRNMWTLAPDMEEKIINYLAEHYPPASVFARRPPLPPELLPKALR
jgi:hypothetical protein